MQVAASDQYHSRPEDRRSVSSVPQTLAISKAFSQMFSFSGWVGTSTIEIYEDSVVS